MRQPITALSVTRKVLEWERALLWYVSALFVFETLTGLAVYLLPFSVPNQMMVLFHTVAGVAMVVPFAVYQVRHWRLYSQIRVSHVKLTGYFAMAATVVLIVSGLVLTAQAMFATRISRAWDFVHIVATFALLGSLVPHVATMLMRVVRAKAAVAVTPVRLASRPASPSARCRSRWRSSRSSRSPRHSTARLSSSTSCRRTTATRSDRSGPSRPASPARAAATSGSTTSGQ